MRETRISRSVAFRSGTLTAVLLLAAPGAMGGGLALAPLAALGGLLAAPWPHLRRLALKAGWPLALLAAFVAWALISTLWSPDRRFHTPPRLAGGVATGLLLAAAFAWRPQDPASALVRRAIVAFVALTAAIGVIEWCFGMPLNRIGHWGDPPSLLERAPMMGTAVLVLVMWSAIALLWRAGPKGYVAAAVLLAAALLSAMLSGMAASLVAVALGAAGFTATLFLGPAMLRLAASF